MESAYVLANRELEEIRLKNQAEQSKRHMEVCTKIPQYAVLENELMKNGTRLLSCILDKRNNFDDVKNSIKELQTKKAEMLKEYGFGADYLDDIYSCEICRDTGFVEGKRCVCLKNLIAKNIGRNSNLTEFMRECTFENFDMSLFANQGENSQKVLKVMQVVCNTAMSFAESFDVSHENILLMGNAGTGKTFVSSCIANRALERGKTVYYQTAYKLFETFEGAKFGKDEDAPDVVKYIYDTELLIIDDLGTEFVTQFTAATLFDIINTRVISGKSTIISTNLDFETLSDMYSQRIASRFIGEYKILQTLGDDIRKIKRIREKI